MVDLLKRSLAPITDEAWKEIDEQARLTLKGNLSARTTVDIIGPKGWKTGSVNVGKVKSSTKQIKGVSYGIREVLPLIEFKVPFTLTIDDLDDVSRGNKAPDLDSVHIAAQKAALFEENAVYYGIEEAGIKGLTQISSHKPLQLGKSSKDYQETIETGIAAIKKAGIGGPYDLILGTVPIQLVMVGDERGFPLNKRIEDMIGGDIKWSPAVRGGVLISKRGGDYELTLGQDFSVGYSSHDKGKVELYIIESFTFQAHEPAAAIEFKMKAA